MSKVHNFSAGPCILPNEVFEKSAESILNFNESGLSLIEISHRSADFVAVMEEARQLVREVLNIPDSYEVLFLQGGASLGFLTAAYNLMGTYKTGGYLVTGAWAKKQQKKLLLWATLLLLLPLRTKTSITYQKIILLKIILIISM